MRFPLRLIQNLFRFNIDNPNEMGSRQTFFQIIYLHMLDLALINLENSFPQK